MRKLRMKFSKLFKVSYWHLKFGFNPQWASLVALVKNWSAVQETQVRYLGWEDPLEKGMVIHSSILVWRIPWTQEPGGLQSLGWEDPLEKEVATHSSILAWRIPWTEEPGGLQFMGVQSQTWLKYLHMDILMVLSFLLSEHDVSFYLFRYPFIFLSDVS